MRLASNQNAAASILDWKHANILSAHFVVDRCPDSILHKRFLRLVEGVIMGNNPGDDKTIGVKRRRQGASAGPDSSERAEMPSRQQQGEGGGPYGPSGGGTRSGGTKLPLWLVILLVIGFGLYNLLFPGQSGNQTDTGVEQNPTAAQEQAVEFPTQPEETYPTSTAVLPAVNPAQGSVPGQKWTVMLYQDADDQILEQDIFMDLNEVERVGSTDRVQIVSQIDRYKGAFTGDGDWTSTRRYHITKDNDLQHIHSQLVADMGELDMASGTTLLDYVTWAVKAYPADKYVLILSDHGMGWPGGMSDNDPVVQDTTKAPLASALSDDQLYMSELEKALAAIAQKTDIGKFELIGMDACLMGQVEVLSALEPYARYAVLSQETEPALGWAYTGFLQPLVDNPDMSGADLSKQIVSSYIQDDQRINDPQARADFLRQGSPLGGLFGPSNQISAASLAQQIGRSATLTAADLSSLPGLMASLNTLAYTLQDENQDLIASARTYAPAFTNVFGKDSASPYIDLGGFIRMLEREGANAKTKQAADQVLSDIQQTVIAEKHGSDKPGSTGISIYFPTSKLYRSPISGPQSYTVIADRFAQASLWDDFLASFYNGRSFTPEPGQPVLPQPGAPSRSPGLGQIQVSPITLSGQTASPGNPVTLTARVSGKNIGYIYLFVGYYDQSANAIFTADTDYLESPSTQQLNGVFYPQWNGDKPFNLKFDWDPTLFQITDGKNTTVALFTPQSYGASAQDAVYTVDGLYHYADGTSRSARLSFRDGVMRQVFGYTDQNETGGVREIIPQAGDTFTILEKWLDLGASGKVTQSASQEGAVLTFGSQPFKWKEVYAGAGNYVVGFIIEDLDGNTQEVYTQVAVE
jgi:hypothetical protein